MPENSRRHHRQNSTTRSSHTHTHSFTLTHTHSCAHTHSHSLTLTHKSITPSFLLALQRWLVPDLSEPLLLQLGTGPPGPGAPCRGTWGCAPGAPRRVGTRGCVLGVLCRGTWGHAPATLCGVWTRGPAPRALQELLDLELRPLLSPCQPCDSDHWTLSPTLKVSPPEDTCCRPCHSTWSTRWLPLPQSIKILTPCPQAHCIYI